MPTLRAVLFDLDGTLANTDPIHFQVWQRVLARFDIPLDEALYQSTISGRLNPEILRDLLPQLSQHEALDLAHAKEAEYREVAIAQLQPLPGLLEVLTTIDRQSLAKAVVTNAPRANAEFMLAALDLSDRFPTLIIADELAAAKPDPLPYLEGLRRLGVSAEDSLAFEDSPAGLRAAVAAGIPTIGIATSHAPSQLYALGAKLVIPDFNDPHLQDLGLGHQA
jgi:HAD superfamily hydrolase (TIGR01509 family)